MHAIEITVPLRLDEAETAVRATLADNGFGVLTELDPSSSLVLPCNVVPGPGPDGGTRISAVDPRELMPDPAFAELANSAAAQLTAALQAVGT